MRQCSVGLQLGSGAWDGARLRDVVNDQLVVTDSASGETRILLRDYLVDSRRNDLVNSRAASRSIAWKLQSRC